VWIGLHSATADAVKLQAEIHGKARFPLLQERTGKDVRAALGRKSRHDVFVFDAKGKLSKQIVDVQNAHTGAGYAALKKEIEPLLP